MGIQSFGLDFDLKKLLRARSVARDMTHELASLIEPGMSEEEAHQLYKELLTRYPVEKQWHPPKLRFGPNTICNFKDPSVPYRLQEEDLFFIDIGPVVEGHEADYGETFTLGENFEYKLLAGRARDLFAEVSECWLKRRPSGPELYSFAEKRAKEWGYLFNSHQDGHRIGDFPHHIHFKGGLAECEETVVANAWILEIHLWEPRKRFGAFFEDLLTDET